MKLAFWSVFSAGFVACSALGIGPVLKRMGGDWTSAPMVIGIVLGVMIVVLAVMFATGLRPALMRSDAALLYALAAVIAAKVAVGALAMSGVFGGA